MLRQGSPNLPRFGTRKHRIRFDSGVVIGDPIHHRIAISPEFIRTHVTRLRFRHFNLHLAGARVSGYFTRVVSAALCIYGMVVATSSGSIKDSMKQNLEYTVALLT